MDKCINADHTGQCFYFTKPSNRAAHGLTCDVSGRCINADSWRCVKYNPEVIEKEKGK